MFKNKNHIRTPRRNEAFAEIYVYSGAAAQAVPTGAGYTKMTAFATAGLEKRCETDIANDKITIYKPGIYRVSGLIYFICGTVTIVYGSAFIGGVQIQNCTFKKGILSSSKTTDGAINGFINVSETSDLDFRMRHEAGGSVNITIEYANLNAEYIASN